MDDKSYDEFFEQLGQRESNGDYQAENTLGYIGKYQMGEAALIDTGYYKTDGKNYNNEFVTGNWTGKDGVWSREDFLNNQQAQETAVRTLAEKNWNTIQRLNLDQYVGQTINGVEITESGLLGGAHLKGVGKGGVIDFLKAVIEGQNAYGTNIKEYVESFGGYDTPYTPQAPEPEPDINEIDNSYLDLQINTDLTRDIHRNAPFAIGGYDWRAEMPDSVIKSTKVSKYQQKIVSLSVADVGIVFTRRVVELSV
jgi:hypothetical protein